MMVSNGGSTALAIRYREDKATQAAARLLKLGGGQMSHMKLIKLLYLADRSSLVRWGRPITFDWYFSLDHGPVLSFTLDRINAEADPEAPSYWHRYVSERENHSVRLLSEPDNDQLSAADEEIIDEIFSRFGAMSQWDLRDYCHRLPEWQDPHGSRVPIEIRDILLAEGLSEEDVQEITAGLQAETSAIDFLT
jgi:uncharacterized phage-associated protein